MSQIQIRQATTHADECAVLEIGRVAFSKDIPAQGYAAMRLTSAFHLTADWWLLEENGRPVTSLLSFPLTFGTPSGTVQLGVGLGSVGTLPDARKRGHGSALCAHVCAHAAANGRPLGLLFSAIAPTLYARLGFVATSAYSHRCTDVKALAQSGTHATLVPINPWRQIARLSGLYDHEHRGTLHLSRDPDAWKRSIERGVARDLWFGLGSPDRLSGYVRVAKWDDGMSVRELCVESSSTAAVLRSIGALTADFGLDLLTGWFSPIDEVQEQFETGTREQTLPMVRGIQAGLEDARFWSSDYF